MTELVAGLPLVAVVMAIVEYLKRVGVSGNALLYASMGAGIILGVAYQVTIRLPVSAADWLGAAVYGIVLGLTASGVYDAGRSMSRNGQ